MYRGAAKTFTLTSVWQNYTGNKQQNSYCYC